MKKITALIPLIIVFLLFSIGSLNAENTYYDDEISPVLSGKRSHLDIYHYTQSMKVLKKTGFEKKPAEKWLDSDKSVSARYGVEKKLAYLLHSAKKNAVKATAKTVQTKDAPQVVADFLSIGEKLKSVHKDISANFDETLQTLINKGMSPAILERHYQMVDTHNEKMRSLLANYDRLDQMSGELMWSSALDLLNEIKEQLSEYQPVKEPPMLNNNTPYGIRYIEAPVVMMDEGEIDYAQPSQLPGNRIIPLTEKPKSTVSKEETTLPAMGASAVMGLPSPEDLAATIDVQITQEIVDLAVSLDNSALKIFNYVKNQLDFEPYLGSRKGSVETLRQNSGNDYDQATLLIALLRAAGIPSRYVRGVVELPVDRVKQWLGVDDGSTAGSILTTVGMEGVNIVDGTGDVVSIRFRHVWVEAYIPYANYRGIPVDATGSMWIAMDPSIKDYNYQPGTDILTEMGFNAETFIDNYITTFHTPSPVELLINQISDHLAANHPELTYDDITRTRSIATENHGFIPGSLPFLVRSIDSDFAQIPADKRYTIRFRLYDSGTTFIDYSTDLPVIAGKRVTISYIPASQADQDVIDSYGDLYDVPPYLVNLKPVLKIDGITVATGSTGIGMGQTHSSDMHFTTPVGDSNQMPLVSNSIIAGTYQAIGIDTGKINPDIFLPDNGAGPIDNDSITGGKLWKTAMGYLDRVEQYDSELEKTMQMVVTKDVSEAIVENTILVTYSFGTPQTFEWTGLVVDADRCIVGPFSVNGDPAKKKQFMVISGADGSISENRIFEDEYDEESVSTIKILELASDMGIPIYTFNSATIGSIYSTLNLSSSVESAVYSAVAAGHEVTIPRDNITYSEWYGTGYIDMDPSTGAAGYIISGGHSGGATVDVWLSWKMTWFTIFKDLCSSNPITANITFPPANSYFPKLNWIDYKFNNKLKFEVTYTICYDGGGSKTVYETFKPHYQYSPGNYTFNAGWGTGTTRNYSVFGVDIETPDGEKAFSGCDTITLETKFTPSTPPGVTYQWEKDFCLFGCGDGTFTPATVANTEFKGTDPGSVKTKIKASNTYGTTKATKALKVIGVSEIKAEDSDDSSNSVTDDDKNVETEIKTIYVLKKDTGTIDISVTPDPASTAEGVLPSDWKIEKISGSLDFDGTPGKLSAKVKKDTVGDIIVKVSACIGFSDHFSVRIIIGNVDIDIDIDTNNDGTIDNIDDQIEKDTPGKIILYNGDDDNNNSKPDRDDAGSVSNENDLTELILAYDNTTPNNYKIILETSAGSTNIKIWEKAIKDKEIILPKTFVLGTDAIPSKIYAEGYNSGEAMMDMVLKTDSDVEIGRDKVKLTVAKIELEPITLNPAIFPIYNPSGIENGKTAKYEIEVEPATIVNDKIKWTKMNGSISFSGGDTGRLVTVKGDGTGTAKIKVDIAGFSEPTIEMEVLDKKTVDVYVYIIRKDDGTSPATTEANATALLNSVNDIYEQIAIEFVQKGSVSYINNTSWLDIQSSGDNYQEFKDICSSNQNTGGIEMYFIDTIDGATGINYSPNAKDAGIVISDAANFRTVAHELGHACGLLDIYIENKTGTSLTNELVKETWEPKDWNNGQGPHYYAMDLKQKDLIQRLLLYGIFSNTKAVISSGKIYGYKNSGSTRITGMVEVGLEDMDRTPEHW